MLTEALPMPRSRSLLHQEIPRMVALSILP
jgi:hypothetical protein